MTVLGGFTGLSFYYSDLLLPALVTVADGSGKTIASMLLPAATTSCGGDPSGAFTCWPQVTVGFSGIAQSVKWSSLGTVMVDNISLDTVRAVPEPASLVLFRTWGHSRRSPASSAPQPCAERLKRLVSSGSPNVGRPKTCPLPAGTGQVSSSYW